ncbi:protein NLRC3-like [Orbicella faveolata]|uniref:protein NLRC3-like n=1 Tax=Orbicella faveolata TaxID=48498 RepID=UPI0009E3BDF3|nr:protein NLRC3-like [Orbicella faveolata]
MSTSWDLSSIIRMNELKVKTSHDPRFRAIPKVYRSPKISSHVRLASGAKSRVLNAEKTFQMEKEQEENNNNVDGVSSPFEFFRQHSFDKQVDLNGWIIDPKAACEIGSQLVPRSTIVRLSLANSHLGDEGGKAVAKGLEENFSVRELDLSGDMLGQNAISSIGEMLNKNQTVEKLNLSRNNLTDPDVESLLAALCRKTVLKELDLSQNILCDQFAKQMSFVLEKNFVLEKLFVNSNQLEVTGLQAFLPGLRKTKTLSAFNISWNYLRDQGAEILGEVIASNRSLVEISACGNLFTPQAASFIAKGVANNSKLKVLRIGQNLIRSTGAFEFLNVFIAEGGLSESGMPTTVLEILDINGTIVDEKFKELIETELTERFPSVKVVNFSLIERVSADSENL